MRLLHTSVTFWRLSLVLAMAAHAGLCRADDVGFNRDVRPILAEHCYACHGPDARNRKAGLRLDDPVGALGELPTGNRAIVPGELDESELVARLDSEDTTLLMPPPKVGKPLSPSQKDVLRRWVAEGARWERHWSLAPIRRPTQPAAYLTSSARGPIDLFVRAEARRHGVAHAPEADRVTLIRRLGLDLIGLPPRADEVEQFLRDDRPDAYERLVDRLLASPHFGERLAMYWLDLVRYADSVGYHGDQAVSVSPFRDYVIDAFNANMPFDRFTIEQLAGDLLPQPTREQRVASGYNRLGMMSAEGGVQPKEYLAKYAAERVRNIGGAWLGVTLGCCECHDHKYDPFTTRDFYRMEAFFADLKERGLYSGSDFGPSMLVPSPEQEGRLVELDRQIDEVRAVMDRSTPELEADQSDWEHTINPSIEWVTLRPTSAGAKSGATLTILEDGSVLASGPNPATETYTIEAPLPRSGVKGLRIDVLPDESLPQKGPGRAGNGNFVLTEFTAALRRGPDTTLQPLVLEHATATFEQTQAAEKHPDKRWSIASAIDGDARGAGHGWAVLGDAGQANAATFETVIDLPAEEGATIRVELLQNHENAGHTLGRFRLSFSTTGRPLTVAGSGLPRPVRDALAVATRERSAAQKETIAAHFRTIAPKLAPERARLAEVEKARASLVGQITTMLATETVPPRPIRVLPRGNWMDDSGELVEPGVPSVLPQCETTDQRPGRLDLGRWLVAPENPLTARTLVNRLWKLYLGAGLAHKLDDLGTQGEWPSHPELLDWLAGRLIDSGWDLKGTIRLIVTSDTYKQSSVPTREQLERDPTNRWLGRQGRFRLDAELVRDSVLSISGLLVEDLGGPSARPYQPPGYWSFLNFPTREWQNESGGRKYRRGLYTHWQRQYLYPSLMAFDAPSREECTADRVRSATPLQALVLLNDPAYVEAARALAERALREGGTTLDDRLDWATRWALSRPIRPEELEVLGSLHGSHLEHYRRDTAAARALLQGAGRPPADDQEAAELAAWTGIARAILNLHTVSTRN
jgi:hypothetical protein